MSGADLFNRTTRDGKEVLWVRPVTNLGATVAYEIVDGKYIQTVEGFGLKTRRSIYLDSIAVVDTSWTTIPGTGNITFRTTRGETVTQGGKTTTDGEMTWHRVSNAERIKAYIDELRANLTTPRPASVPGQETAENAETEMAAPGPKALPRPWARKTYGSPRIFSGARGTAKMPGTCAEVFDRLTADFNTGSRFFSGQYNNGHITAAAPIFFSTHSITTLRDWQSEGPKSGDVFNSSDSDGWDRITIVKWNPPHEFSLLIDSKSGVESVDPTRDDLIAIRSIESNLTECRLRQDGDTVTIDLAVGLKGPKEIDFANWLADRAMDAASGNAITLLGHRRNRANMTLRQYFYKRYSDEPRLRWEMEAPESRRDDSLLGEDFPTYAR